MKRVLASVILLLCSQAQAFDIVAALNLGQQVELRKCEAVDDAPAEAAVIQATLERVRIAAGIDHPLPLRIARCSSAAQVLQGVVVAHPSIASWTEGERMFVLAHEIGHVVHGDWHTLTETFSQIVPAEATDAEVGPALNRQAGRIRHMQHGFEFEADAFACALLAKMGRDGVIEGTAVLRKDIPRYATPTHPGTRERLAALTH